MSEHDDHLGDPEGLVSGSFDSYEEAEDATAELIEEGFPVDRISVLLSEQTREAYLEIHPELAEEDEHILAQTVVLDRETRALEGAGVGGTVGGTLGAAAGAVAAIGTVVTIPPFGLVVAGPLALGLAGAGAGGAAGTLAGALTGAGMSQLRARRFEELLEDGDVIVTVRTKTAPEKTLAVETLDKHGAELVEPGE